MEPRDRAGNPVRVAGQVPGGDGQGSQVLHLLLLPGPREHHEELFIPLGNQCGPWLCYNGKT